MHELLDWVYSIAIALVLAMIIHIFVFVPTRVSGESMYPTLNNGQYLIVSKIGHVFHKDVNYGDIVIIDSRVDRPRTWADDVEEPLDNYLSIFSSSAQQHNVWVKRVIGKGGDVLAFHDGHVYRNGKANLWNSPWMVLLPYRRDMYLSWGITATTAVTVASSDRFRFPTCWEP